MKGLEDTPAVVSLGKVCDEHGYSYEWITGQKPLYIRNGIRIQCNTENFVPIVVLGLSTCSSSSFPLQHPWHFQGRRSSYIYLKLVFFSNYDSIKRQGDSRQRRSKCNWFPSSPCVKFKCWRDDGTVKPVICWRFWCAPQANHQIKMKPR